MALHLPPAFVPADPALALRLIDEHPFATLVTSGAGEPQVTHLPLLRDGEGTLIGHVARANPHWQALAAADSLAIFAGPHAYVSPTWYAEPDAAVPTWNFTAVHVVGRAEVVSDTAACERLMAAMVARFEGEDARAWRFALTGSKREAMLRAIVAFRLPMTSITAKLKLSQNRSAGDFERVAAMLERGPEALSRATAAWMRRVEAPR